MTKEVLHIPFHNHQNPGVAFDIIKIEDVLRREDLEHSPCELHLVEFYMVILIHQGQGMHTIDFVDYPYQPGTLLTVRKDQIHKFDDNLLMKGTLLLFTDDFLVSYLEKLEALRSLQLFNDILSVPKIQLSGQRLKEVTDLIGRMEKEYFKINDAYSLGILRSELSILIAKLYRIKSNEREHIFSRKYLKEFIQLQNLVEKNINTHHKVQAYAKMMGVSTKTLNTITKTILHKTAKEFLDEIWTKQMKRLLINTDASVKEVAYASGFEETTNFYKYFKRQTKLTPEQFRAKFQ